MRRLYRVGIIGLAWVGAVTVHAQAPDLSRMDLVLKSVPDGPVAMVRGVAISADEFKDLYVGEVVRWAQLRSGEQLTDALRVKIALNSLRLLIEREILRQEAVARKLTVTPGEVEAAWKRHLEQLQKQFAQSGTEPLSEAEVLKRASTTREKALAELRKALLANAMREQIVKEKAVTVSDKEVAQWFATHKEATRRPDMCHLKDILIQVPTKGAPGHEEVRRKAKDKAENALQRIRAGQSFEAVAKEVSDGPQKAQGGDLGVVPMDQLPETVAKVVRALRPGEVSNVVEGDLGFHIFKLVEFVPGAQPSLEEAKPEIRRLLLAEKSNQAVADFCAKITADEKAVQVFLALERQLVTRPDLLREVFPEETPRRTGP